MDELKYYEDLHNKNFPNKLIKVLKIEKRNIYFETEFGICKATKYSLRKASYDIRCAIDKNKYFINELIKVYGNKYDYSLVEYTKARSKIKLICKKHGVISVIAYAASIGKAGCMKCMGDRVSIIRSSNTEEFIKKATKIHHNLYDYNLVIYQKDRLKIKIICKEHGEFEQTPMAHLKKQGCPKCGTERSRQHHIKNPVGWNLTNWIKTAKNSKEFKGFGIYIIKCWNDQEEFYKIGRTFKEVKRRFCSKNQMPYNYEILKEIKGEAEEIYKLETRLKQINKKHKYIPLIYFSGLHECFKKLENYEGTI